MEVVLSWTYIMLSIWICSGSLALYCFWRSVLAKTEHRYLKAKTRIWEYDLLWSPTLNDKKIIRVKKFIHYVTFTPIESSSTYLYGIHLIVAMQEVILSESVRWSIGYIWRGTLGWMSEKSIKYKWLWNKHTNIAGSHVFFNSLN